MLEMPGCRFRTAALPCGATGGTLTRNLSGGRVQQLSRRQLPSNMTKHGWPADEDAVPCPTVTIEDAPEHAKSASSGPVATRE